MSDKIFMFLDTVSGSSTDTSHTSWIPVDSVFFETTRKVEFKAASEKKAPETTSPVISKIIITKPHCTASTQLYTNLNTLQKSKLIIDIVQEKPGAGNIVENVVGTGGSTRLESDVCYVSGFKLSGVGTSSEEIELTVSSLAITYNPPKDSHELDKKTTSGYHFQRSKTL